MQSLEREVDVVRVSRTLHCVVYYSHWHRRQERSAFVDEYSRSSVLKKVSISRVAPGVFHFTISEHRFRRRTRWSRRRGDWSRRRQFTSCMKCLIPSATVLDQLGICILVNPWMFFPRLVGAPTAPCTGTYPTSTFFSGILEITSSEVTV